jgi:hypothetical protein
MLRASAYALHAHASDGDGEASCHRNGRPQISVELRALIRRISIEKPLWGAPRIHGELLKLGFEVGNGPSLLAIQFHIEVDPRRIELG